ILNAAFKKALNLLKKGLLIPGEAVESSKRRSLLKHKGSSEGSGIIPEVPDEPKDNSCSSKHLSDTKVLTMKMEILLEPTSNKLLVGVDNTAKTKRPQPKSNTKNDRVPSASKRSCIKNKEVEVDPRNLLLSKNKKHMSSECNNVKLVIRNDKSEVVCAMCKQCLITANHDVCVVNYVNGMNSRSKKQKAKVPNIKNQTKLKPHVKKHKKVGSNERLALPKLSKPRSCLRWSPTGRIFDLKGKIIANSEFECQSNCSNGDNACTSNPQNLQEKGTVRFGNYHVALILVYGDLQWGNILITKVYFIKGLGHNLFSVGQFCDLDLESWLWHQRLSHLNFDTINDLAKNDLVTGLLKFKYHKEHLCPSCEQGKSKRVSYPPKLVLNSKQRLHLLHMNLCGPMRIASINGKRVACYTQNRSIIHLRFDKTPYELINSRKPDISFLYVFGDLCYPKNDREDIGKLGAKGEIGFFIGYSANSCAYRVYNRRKKKIIKTMNVTFHELSAMAFEQSSLKPGLQSMTSGQINSGLELTYVPSTITAQQPCERELNLLFEAMYDDYIGGQPSAATSTVPAAQAPQVLQTPSASTTIAYTTPTPTTSSLKLQIFTRC
nr:hypothetical protein [Tanacetum cinerariifolium]